jgi:hypothetical protein
MPGETRLAVGELAQAYGHADDRRGLGLAEHVLRGRCGRIEAEDADILSGWREGLASGIGDEMEVLADVEGDREDGRIGRRRGEENFGEDRSSNGRCDTA